MQRVAIPSTAPDYIPFSAFSQWLNYMVNKSQLSGVESGNLLWFDNIELEEGWESNVLIMLTPRILGISKSALVYIVTPYSFKNYFLYASLRVNYSWLPSTVYLSDTEGPIVNQIPTI